MMPTVFFKKKKKLLPEQDLTRFDDQDIILESEAQIQEFLPDILGQRHSYPSAARQDLYDPNAHYRAR